jgi:prepilin-type N-terminal cleavage/methylation domain-containing protein
MLGLIFDNKKHQQGFTLIEAIVALVVFAISFSGLFLFFGTAQQTSINTQKKMALNMMANEIIETIAIEGKRAASDPLNPFLIQLTYEGNLTNCSDFPDSDIRYDWCMYLNEYAGPYNGFPDEERRVELTLEGTDLIVDVSFVVDGSGDGRNLVQTYLSRKLRANQL